MQVRSLQGYLRSLKEPLTASNCSPAVVNDLERACVALNPFSGLDLGQLVELLTVADEYRKTGILPDDPLREVLLST